MENQLKVAVELHEGEKSTKKIWRFNADLAAEFTEIQMEKEIEFSGFPSIKITIQFINNYNTFSEITIIGA